jgi:apolipoprotein N-acyltransferase
MHSETKQGFAGQSSPSKADRSIWLSFVAGAVLLPFTVVQTMLPLAAWLAPIFLLRFARQARRPPVALLLIFLAHVFGNALALRGGDTQNAYVMAVGLGAFALLRGLGSTLPYVADRLIGARLGRSGRIFVFPLTFTAIDWLMGLLPAVNSTGSTVYSQYDSLALLQIVSITGMWGIDFLIGWSAATVNALWESWPNWRSQRWPTVAFVAATSLVLLFGAVRVNFAPPSSPTVLAATITIDRSVHDAAFAPPFNWLTFNQSSDAERAAARQRIQATAEQMFERSEAAFRAGAKLVGWQETGALVLEEDKQALLDRASALASKYEAYLQISLGVFTRTQAMPYYLNQSILFDNSGKTVWTYEKSYPVIPTESYVTPRGGRRLPIVDTPYGRMATAICNDFHFQWLIRQAGERGVDIMMAPYNDVHPFEQQDAVVAMMRSVENGYSMVKATGIGPSMIADYQGRVLGRQDYGEGGGIMLASVPTRGAVTIYGRVGDVFAYACLAGLILLAIAAFRPRGAKAPTSLPDSTERERTISDCVE